MLNHLMVHSVCNPWTVVLVGPTSQALWGSEESASNSHWSASVSNWYYYTHFTGGSLLHRVTQDQKTQNRNGVSGHGIWKLRANIEASEFSMNRICSCHPFFCTEI